MGLFATVKGLDKCPRCGKKSEWQSKSLFLDYKGMSIWIGDMKINELDENMNGHITSYCIPKEIGGCGAVVRYEIIKGKLVEEELS